MIAIFLFLSCAHKRSDENLIDWEKFLNSVEVKSLNLKDPFFLTDEIKKEIENYVPSSYPLELKFKKVLSFLIEKGFMDMEYDLNTTLPASDTYYLRKGNCLSFTILFVSLCKHLNIPVFYAYMSEPISFEEKGGAIIISSHIAAGFNLGSKTILVDFNKRNENIKFFEKIDELSVFCLFYNNFAVEEMMKGDYDKAEELLNFLLKIKPLLKEILNNRGVLYMKRGNYFEALKLFRKMAEDGIIYQPSLHNGLICANIQGDKEGVSFFQRKIDYYYNSDPIILYKRALLLLDKGKYDESITLIKKAISKQPRNGYLNGFLSYLYLKKGDREKALKAYKRAKSLSPDLDFLLYLESEFKEIKKSQ